MMIVLTGFSSQHQKTVIHGCITDNANSIPLKITNLLAVLPYKQAVKYYCFIKMHPQITAVLNRVNPYIPQTSDITRDNAEKILNYIEDINLEGHVMFRPISSGSLSVAWKIGDWEYQMECMKNGYIIYTFTKCEYEESKRLCIV